MVAGDRTIPIRINRPRPALSCRLAVLEMELGRKNKQLQLLAPRCIVVTEHGLLSQIDGQIASPPTRSRFAYIFPYHSRPLSALYLVSHVVALFFRICLGAIRSERRRGGKGQQLRGLGAIKALSVEVERDGKSFLPHPCLGRAFSLAIIIGVVPPVEERKSIKRTCVCQSVPGGESPKQNWPQPGMILGVWKSLGRNL